MKNKLIGIFDKCTAWTDYLLVILSVFSCTFFIYKSFDLRMLYGYAVLGLILAVHILRRIIFKNRVELSPLKIAFSFMVLVILVHFCMPKANQNRDTVSYIISMVICTAYLVFSSVSSKEIKLVKTVLIVFGIGLSLYTIVCGVFPNVYWDYIFPHLSKATQVMAKHYIPRGYGVPVGGSYTLVTYALSLAMPVIVGILLVKKNSKLNTALLVAALYVFFVAVLLEGRRGEFVAILGTFAVVYLFTVNIREKKQLLKRLVRGVVIVVTVAIVFFGIAAAGLAPRYISTAKTVISNTNISASDKHEVPEDIDEVVDDTEDVELEPVDVTSGRTELWRIAGKLFAEKPVFGVGWSSFAKHVPEEFNKQHANGGQGAVVNVHNTYLQFLCETGIVGTILILVPLFYCFAQTCMQTVRLNKRHEEENMRTAVICNTAALGIQCFFLVVNIIDMSFYHYKFWGFYIIGIAFGIVALRQEGYNWDDRFTLFFKKLFRRKKTTTEDQGEV